MTSPSGDPRDEHRDDDSGETDALGLPIGAEQRRDQREAVARGEAARESRQDRPGGTP